VLCVKPIPDLSGALREFLGKPDSDGFFYFFIIFKRKILFKKNLAIWDMVNVVRFGNVRSKVLIRKFQFHCSGLRN